MLPSQHPQYPLNFYFYFYFSLFELEQNKNHFVKRGAICQPNAGIINLGPTFDLGLEANLSVLITAVGG
jgi:hypothetical protein